MLPETIMRGSENSAAGPWFLMVAVAVIAITASGAQAEEKAKAPPSIWEQDTLTGDWGGVRTVLHAKGVDVTLNYIGEVFAVLSGGLQRRASYEGRLEFSVDSDLQKLIGWTGGSSHFTIYQIHNSGRDVVENVDPFVINLLMILRERRYAPIAPRTRHCKTDRFMNPLQRLRQGMRLYTTG